MPNQYVSDLIGNEYSTWDSKKPIIINAPMGSGKTYFVLNVLLPYVHSHGKRMVYVANHTALERQVSHDIPDAYRDSIITCSYQQLAYFHAIRNKKKEDQSSRKMESIAVADYYILDEAHYFLADATFNSKVKNCFSALKGISQKNKASIWIFMTGTIEYLLLQLRWQDFTEQPNKLYQPAGLGGFEIPFLKTPSDFARSQIHSVRALLKYKEMELWKAKRLQIPVNLYEAATGRGLVGLNISFDPNLKELYNCFQCQYFQNKFEWIRSTLYSNIESKYQLYRLPKDFAYITPVYFNDWEEIVAAILRTPPEEKWIIFVSNEADGDVLLQQLMEAGCTDIAFMTAERRKNSKLLESKVFQEIVDEAAFHRRVLITTKVLDNGVNLKDKSLRHMAVGFFDETTFLQIVGRKRQLDQSDCLKLYLKNESEGSIQRHFKNHVLQILLFWRDLLDICSSSRRPEYFFPKLNKFAWRYIEDGKYKYPFYKYIVEKNIGLSLVQNRQIKDESNLLVDLYQPVEYCRHRFSYDFYRMMALFEKAQNERFCIAAERGIKTEEDFQESEHELQSQQFMWLRTQLSWLGLSDRDFDPHDPKNWITSHSGQTQQSKQELLAFLDGHSSESVLSEEEEATLKALFQHWIQNVRPKHKDKNSRGSLCIINRCFDELGIPYQIQSRRITVNKKQRNWWKISKRETVL